MGNIRLDIISPRCCTFEDPPIMWLAIAQSGRAVLLSVAAAAAAVEKGAFHGGNASLRVISVLYGGMYHSIQWGIRSCIRRRLCVARLRDVENMGGKGKGKGKGGEERRGEEGCAGSPTGGAAV